MTNNYYNFIELAKNIEQYNEKHYFIIKKNLQFTATVDNSILSTFRRSDVEHQASSDEVQSNSSLAGLRLFRDQRNL